MKRAITLLLAALLAVTCACAEAPESLIERLDGVEWSFSSGAGGWSTDMRILPDGSFSGEFHDSEMGEYGDEYPNGTIYSCSFTGSLSEIGQVDEDTWRLRIDALSTDASQPPEYIDDGTRYVLAEPYGLSLGDEMLLYQPGAPVEGFTEDMMMWAHLMDAGTAPDALEYWFLYSEANDSGFVGFPNDVGAWMVNPWVDVTEEELEDVSGLRFGVPEGAEDVIYRWMEMDGLAEMQFTWLGNEFCARAQAAELDEGELMDISGMYFDWEDEEDIDVSGFHGTLGRASTGSEDWVERCLWYDWGERVMYSLSVSTTDPDSIDLTAIAGQVFAVR